ncbi:cytosolic sulfotransferase 8-like [Aristolochia californica]|uniref:cytosolic sulfotransferase 8-like n=1 Tax=Aristolochia californica TaxID=171875 RepID=UPI0035DB5E84
MADCAEIHDKEEETSIDRLPKLVSCGMDYYQFKGCWMFEELLKAAVAMRAHFQPDACDVILTSFPKTGTTWLEAFVYTILHHNKPPTGSEGPDCASGNEDADPLVARNPHELIPCLEFEIYPEHPHLSLDKSASPRIFQTHFPYEILPESVKESSCKIVYIARNPADTIVSLWQFTRKISYGANISFGEAFDAFCEGTVGYGPYFEHVMGYWNQRKRVFFITYEELQEDPHSHVTRLAQFLGGDLGEEDVMNIVWRCSFERLSNVKANKGREDIHWSGYPYDAFFRRGVVGDWKNHLTEEMTQRLQRISDEKLEGSGLQFKWDKETIPTSQNAEANDQCSHQEFSS